MSDVMFFGVLRMPYEMAMRDELSRRQFYDRAQEAADRLEAAERATPPSPSTAPTAEMIERMKSAIEGECDGLAITDEHAAAILAYVLEPAPSTAQQCTCPSGDGSLRWPCPEHPPSTASEVGEPAVEDFEKWVKGRGALGVGALPERIFIAGWLAGKRRAAVASRPEVESGDLPPLPKPVRAGDIYPEAAEPAGQQYDERFDCPACRGSGEGVMMEGGGPDAYEVPCVCSHCGGSGALDDAYRGVCALLSAEREKYLKLCAEVYATGFTSAPVPRVGGNTQPSGNSSGSVDIEAERNLFEAWARANCGSTDEPLARLSNGGYEWGRTADMFCAWKAGAACRTQAEGAKDRYNELLFAVARKFPGESRHETALRYIREAEAPQSGTATQKADLPQSPA